MEKKFKSIFPKWLLEKAEKQWRQNPPKIVMANRTKNKKVKEFLLNKYCEKWWKEGGHKKVNSSLC